MSPHVGNRPYRAPELVLQEPDYDQSVDIWALGCVIAEIIHCSKPYVQPLLQIKDRHARKAALKGHLATCKLFPAQSDYPTSPSPTTESSMVPDMNEMDQLNVINRVLGDLTTDDTSFITEMSALKRQKRA